MNKALKAIDRAIAELQEQLEGLEEARAQISGTRRVAKTTKKTKAQSASTETSTEKSGKKKGGRGKFTEAQKKAASERMKKSWAERRARGEVPPKKVKPPKKKKAAKKVVQNKSIFRGRSKKDIGGAGEQSSAKMYNAWQQYKLNKNKDGQ